MSKRMIRLLKQSAKDLRSGYAATLSHEFLMKHNVTFDESAELAERIAQCIDGSLDASSALTRYAKAATKGDAPQ